MNRIILLFGVIIFGLINQVEAYTVTTYQPTQSYPQVFSAQPNQGLQSFDYSTNQAYSNPYNQTYSQNPYQSPYQVPYQGQCVNPYQYQNPYAYGNNLPYTASPTTSELGTSGGTQQLLKNIAQSIIFSKLRGY